MTHLIGKHGAVMIDGKIPVCVECGKEVIITMTNKNKKEKEYLSQMSDESVWEADNIDQNKNKIVGSECPCGVSFQHIHLKGEGLKNPISVVDAIDRKLLKDQNKNEGEKEFDEIYPPMWITDGKKVLIDKKDAIVRDKLKSFIRSQKSLSYQEGFIAGADETGEQAKEIRAIEIKQEKEETIKECLEIIEHSIDKTDSFREINQLLKTAIKK